jgi:hypothetical protein
VAAGQEQERKQVLVSVQAQELERGQMLFLPALLLQLPVVAVVLLLQ